jgi:hypothetical protein
MMAIADVIFDECGANQLVPIQLYSSVQISVLRRRIEPLRHPSGADRMEQKDSALARAKIKTALFTSGSANGGGIMPRLS